MSMYAMYIFVARGHDPFHVIRFLRIFYCMCYILFSLFCSLSMLHTFVCNIKQKWAPANASRYTHTHTQAYTYGLFNVSLFVELKQQKKLWRKIYENCSIKLDELQAVSLTQSTPARLFAFTFGLVPRTRWNRIR